MSDPITGAIDLQERLLSDIGTSIKSGTAVDQGKVAALQAIAFASVSNLILKQRISDEKEADRKLVDMVGERVWGMNSSDDVQ